MLKEVFLAVIADRRFQFASCVTAFILQVFTACPVLAASVETEFVTPFGSAYAPLYPRALSSISSIVTVEKGRKFKLIREVNGGFIVEGDAGPFMAPASWYTFDRFVGERSNCVKNSDFDAAGFLSVKLPGEIESSEFFFNNASVKSFYSLAFLLYLKNGRGFDGYERKLREYDEMAAAAAKKKSVCCFMEAFSDFLNAGVERSAVCMRRKLTPQVALGLIEAGKPVVFMSGSRLADGEIVVAYSASGREGYEKRVECYIYGRGLVSFNWREFEGLLDGASNYFMALM